MNRIRLAITAALLLPLAGCATLPPDTRAQEISYQALAAVDAAETLRIADSPARYHPRANPAEPAKAAA
jgi:starvation-inducible outer membrane lipoprotein